MIIACMKSVCIFDELPPSFDGFTITQLSDFHSGSFDNMSAVTRGIEIAKAQQSDLFVFTGDLVNNMAWEVEPYMSLFSQLKAPYGQFSILGNHDYGDYAQWDSRGQKAANFETLKQNHQKLGYRLMLNENTVIKKGTDQLALIGVENWGRGFIQKGDIDKALEGVDKKAFKILLSHDPTHWEEKIRLSSNATIHLTLSGHTHGAQFGVESDKLRWSPVQYRYLDWAGLANEKNRYLYVNRGFGFLAFLRPAGYLARDHKNYFEEKDFLTSVTAPFLINPSHLWVRSLRSIENIQKKYSGGYI